MSHTTRRGFIECAAGLLLSGCASVPNFGFAGKSGKFMDTELGQMIAKGIRDELAMHENVSASEGEAEHAIRDVEAWLDHMKENGYIDDYRIFVTPYAKNGRGLLLFSRVRVKARGYRTAVFDHVVRRNAG